MEELHTDSIDGGHEGQLWARSRARERAYSNIEQTEQMIKIKESKSFISNREAFSEYVIFVRFFI